MSLTRTVILSAMRALSILVTGKAMRGDILAVSPWAEEDPIKRNPNMPLAERRGALEQVARQLLPGGSRANQLSRVGDLGGC